MAERYGNFGKIMFCGIFFLPLLPTGAFFGMMGCLLGFLADKSGLLRRWRWMPMSNGSQLFWYSTS
jgi:hypothetical protein